jgi:serine/threonine protein kinase
LCADPEALLFPGIILGSRSQVICVVTEMAEHGDLAQVIERARNSNERLEEGRIWKWIMQITAALGELHKHYIIHRDIKPANVFLDANDNIKLGDLGIARELEDDSTGAETFVGSPSYIAPELLNGVYGRKADIWSLGVIIHQLMTLEPPFTGNNQAHLYRNIGRFAPAKIPVEYGFSQDLIELSQWTLQKDPIYRPAAIDIYAHATTNWPRRVMGPDQVPFVNAELAVKTFGKDKLEDEEFRVPLNMKRSLGDPPAALPAPRRSVSGISEPSLDSNSSTVDCSKSLGDGWLDKINTALTKL